MHTTTQTPWPTPAEILAAMRADHEREEVRQWNKLLAMLRTFTTVR